MNYDQELALYVKAITPPVHVVQIAINEATEHFAKVLQALFDGVAFPNDKNGARATYHVFSHEGDEIGEFPTHEILYAIYHMRKYHNREVGKLEHWPEHDRSNPAFTFAWEGWFSWKGVLKGSVH